MAGSNERLIRILNDLIATARDGEEGFGKAAKGVHSNYLRNWFTGYAAEWGNRASELEREVRQLGGEPGTMGHYGAVLDRGWGDLEQRIRPKDDTEFLADCQRGIESSLKHYRGAIEKDLPSEVRSTLERHARDIEQSLERLRSAERAKRAG